ncbi:hypothetical protein C8R46DRAFT_1096014 [Mycena filopes]|nr:hypothetical protein C8R46DRAFT_1096014 [Mycena filopes]
MFSFTKSFVALVLGATGVVCLTVDAPTAPQSGGTTTITWTSTSDDSTFSVELTHPSFNQAIAIANNVDPTLDTLTIELPIVPADSGYTLEFVNITNINQVFATSPDFSIAAAPSSAPAPSISATNPPSLPVSGSTTGVGPSTPASGSAISTPILSTARPSSTAPTGSLPVGSGASQSGASSGAGTSTTPSAAVPLEPFFSGIAPVLIALGTAVVAGAWVL